MVVVGGVVDVLSPVLKQVVHQHEYCVLVGYRMVLMLLSKTRVAHWVGVLSERKSLQRTHLGHLDWSTFGIVCQNSGFVGR